MLRRCADSPQLRVQKVAAPGRAARSALPQYLAGACRSMLSYVACPVCILQMNLYPTLASIRRLQCSGKREGSTDVT